MCRMSIMFQLLRIRARKIAARPRASSLDSTDPPDITICRAHYVESEALRAVARKWSVIGKVVSFELRLKLQSEGDCLTESGINSRF